jgi:hypothetical protein
MIRAGSTELENLDLQSRALLIIHPNPLVIQVNRAMTFGGSRSMWLEAVSCDFKRFRLPGSWLTLKASPRKIESDLNARVPGVTTFR